MRRCTDVAGRPQLGSQTIGYRWCELIGHDDPLDHVGEHCGPRPVAEADRDDRTLAAAADTAIDTHEPGRATIAGPNQPASARLDGERSSG